MVDVEVRNKGKPRNLQVALRKRKNTTKKGQDCHFSDLYHVEDREFLQEVLNLDKRKKITKRFSKERWIARWSYEKSNFLSVFFKNFSEVALQPSMLGREWSAWSRAGPVSIMTSLQAGRPRGRSSIPVEGKGFTSSPKFSEGLWSPPSLIFSKYRGLFLRSKAAGAWSSLTSI